MVEKPCAICGKVVPMRGPQKYCPECAALVMSSKKKQTYEERRCEIRREAHIKKYEESKRKLVQTNDAARAAGMTYGQYMAMLRMKEELCTSK